MVPFFVLNFLVDLWVKKAKISKRFSERWSRDVKLVVETKSYEMKRHTKLEKKKLVIL